MRNYIKNQVVDVLRSLSDACRLLNRLIAQKGDSQSEFILLQDMQSAAIEIGETIENSQRQETKAVKILEEACELMWQISQSLSEEKKGLCKRLRRELEEVKIEIESIPTEFEIVFLPYKASMWDSFESIWRAAKNDSASAAYVIPVPYFDRREDGSLGEMHYEGALFPEDVQVIGWKQYDFEKRHPDIIYFHNPYDEFNYVTSVHPFFYSDSLKKYTDKLVYIPYYVCSESTRRENCLQKGIMYADVVIVQSEKIKAEYVKFYRKEIDKNIPPNKFLALGSPKFDKVIRCMEPKNNLAVQWKRRADGRKIILYNTHLNNFLRYEEEALRKIETVFRHFTKRGDVLLLWRPHPLCKATLKAMRPELYEAYLKLEKGYTEEDIGILDEGADMYPAISAADAYYGDSSSMLSLFGVTGNPICIQDTSVTEYRYNRLRFEAAYIGSRQIYFTDADYNTLSRLDKANGHIEYIDGFPGGESGKKRLVSSMGMWKERLWLMPFSEGRACSYDVASGCWKVYELPEQWREENGRQTFLAGKQIGRYYFGFTSRRCGVMKLDMETGDIKYSEGNQQKLEEIAACNSGIICRQDCCEVEGKLYAACLRGNIVLAYDLDREETEMYQVGSINNRYITIAHDGRAFWLTTKEGTVIRWENGTDDIREFTVDISGYHMDWENAFASSLYAEGYLWLFAYSSNMNIRVNVLTYEIEKAYVFPEAYDKENKVRVLKSWYEDGKVYFIDAYSYAMVCMDGQKNAVRYELSAGTGFDRTMNRILRKAWTVTDRDKYSEYIHRENREPGKNLGGFLDYIKIKEPLTDTEQRACFLRFTKCPKGNSGEVIHRRMTERE